MKQTFSWSQKLFLKVNAQIGKKPWRDRLMYVCAHWLIWMLGLVVLATIFFVIRDVSDAFGMVYTVLSRIVLGLVIAYIYAYFFRHPRPFVEFPQIKTIFRTKTSWKSFPSDHSFISFCLACSLYFLGLPWYSVALGIVAATCVAIGRVYVGVHYPRDVIAGAIWAAMVMFLV